MWRKLWKLSNEVQEFVHNAICRRSHDKTTTGFTQFVAHLLLLEEILHRPLPLKSGMICTSAARHNGFASSCM
ncbi:hypothetical protein J6590_002041 [Homalodisca vitripennis]|nr:hypothetical protein J6590_002041 [Homalodisca vitripennis]